MMKATQSKQIQQFTPRILSPHTNKPLLEDVFGAILFNKLKTMLDKDERLTLDMKLKVLFRVMNRIEEVKCGRATLGDVAAEEAKAVLPK